jgi:hypothetical protein
MANKLSVKEYAEHRGVSHTAVHKAIKEGRLKQSVTKDRKTGYFKIDAAIADEEWSRNTDPSRVPVEKLITPPAAEPMNAPEPTAPRAPIAPVGAGYDARDLDQALNHQLKQAKVDLERTKAELKRIELEQRQGTLVPISVVTATVEAEYTVVRQHLLSIPARAAQELAALDDAGQVRKVLEGYIQKALAELAASGEEAGEAGDDEES